MPGKTMCEALARALSVNDEHGLDVSTHLLHICHLKASLSKRVQRVPVPVAIAQKPCGYWNQPVLHMRGKCLIRADMFEQKSDPPGLRTRLISSKPCAGCSTEQKTSVATTLSKVASAQGRASTDACVSVSGTGACFIRRRARATILVSGSSASTRSTCPAR